MTTHYLDDMDAAFTAAGYAASDNLTRFKAWMESEGLNWGTVGAHYTAQTGIAAFADARKAFWEAGLAAGGITKVTQAANGTTDRSPSFTLPVAPVENDYIVIYINKGTVGTGTVPGTWSNVLASNLESDAHSSYMLYHKVTAAEAGASQVTWTLTNMWASSSAWTVTAVVLRGVDTVDPLAGTAGTSFNSLDTNPYLIASTTPDADNTYIVSGVGSDGIRTQTDPAGWTEITSHTATTPACYLYACDAPPASGVATGTANVTGSVADEYTSITQAFKPA